MEIIAIIGIVIGSIILLTGLCCCIFGFRILGVAGGSCAACLQSTIGNVVKGSCFAIMTCLGMKGCFIAMIIIGLIVLIIFGIYEMINSEWFQNIIEWFENAGDSFKDKIGWIINIFSETHKKFLSL